ncbi:Methionine--tRNA ligase, mitochondrial [Gryllus bimaculatus]|nr:Methionine--tRNA ligase, mitochondrial [Gryllus bimaculatus]
MRGRNFCFITTPIFYVNAAPHIGHLYSAVIADAYHRLKRLDGYGHTIFSTGTDEHGTKIQDAAKKNKQTLKDYCDGMSLCYRTTFEKFNVGFTDYIRTTDERHKKAVHHFWDCIKSKGHIYQGKYAGWYCISEESFLSEGQLTEKPGPDGKLQKVSAETGHSVEWTEEENFMFRLSSFQNDLLYWLKDDHIVQPLKFHKQLVSWIQDDSLMQDISISRSKERVHWGIPVPDNSDQTIYVWLEALVNYLSVVGYPDNQFQRFWPPDVQVIGKDILKFHGIYWPAFLMAAGLDPPRTLFCHSHWTVNQEKMSKSKNNIVDPNDMLQTYGSNGFRYFLLREGTPHSDANFSATKVKNILNSELADSLGNLLNRCCSRAVNPKQIFPLYNQDSFAKYCESDAKKLISHLTTLPGM